MGIYLNPGNEAFRSITRSDYVDKTGMIELINRTIGTTKNLICISRPRRFGKSYAAQMLAAYYDKTCDSHELFAEYVISEKTSYEKYLNKFDVIYWDMTGIKPYSDKFTNLVPYLIDSLSKEIKDIYPDVEISENLSSTLVDAVAKSGNKFVILIDEWDAPIRENPKSQEDYLEFLRSLFKNSGATAKIFAAAYMTGILPIKKDGSQSAISDFEEFTVVKPRQYGKYVGFTESEVLDLCIKHSVSFEKMRTWYDGYEFKGVGAVYNPNSVMKALTYDDFDSYWSESSAAEGLMNYISKPYNGLAKTIAELIGGVKVKVDTNGFANDLTTFRGKDDVLTLMIHLGYLAYDSEEKTAYIPNEEIRLEFQKAIREVKHDETTKRLMESEKLFLDTIEMNEEAVAEQIEKIHREETSPIHYNKEDSLRSVIKLSYYTYRDHYLQWEELPAGEGYADIVYLPKHDSDWPALLIELKWNKTAETAIDQIKDRRYPEVLRNYGGEIILVGVNYDKNAPAGKRKHSCRIEKI